MLVRFAIFPIMLRYASCCQPILVRFCWREVIFVLNPDTAFSIMDSVSMPLARPVITFLVP